MSSRAFVGTNANNLVAGFVITGTTSETVLIRAVGPGLSAFGVAGVLPDPQLKLFDSNGALLSTTTGWRGNSALSAAFTRVGAFELAPNSKDAALLVTLPPGSYTAQVSGASDDTGVAIIEVYDVP